MTTTEMLERRLAAVEADLAKLKSQRPGAQAVSPDHWWQKIHGTFENDEAFQEAMRLGRKWRESQRPKARRLKAKRK